MCRIPCEDQDSGWGDAISNREVISNTSELLFNHKYINPSIVCSIHQLEDQQSFITSSILSERFRTEYDPTVAGWSEDRRWSPQWTTTHSRETALRQGMSLHHHTIGREGRSLDSSCFPFFSFSFSYASTRVDHCNSMLTFFFSTLIL